MTRTPIVYYHSIGGLPPQSLDAAVFEEHLRILARHGRVATTLRAWLDDPDPRAVVLTFDDGLQDHVDVALPLLDKYGAKGTFFVVPAHADATRWGDPTTGRWSDEPKPGFTVPHPCATHDGWRELHRAGMEVAAHGWSHRELARLSDEEIHNETTTSREVITDVVGTDVVTMSYPKGSFDRRVVRAVRDAGYRAACSTIPGWADRWPSRWLLPRLLIEDPAVFDDAVRGRLFRPDRLVRLGFRTGARLFGTRPVPAGV